MKKYTYFIIFILLFIFSIKTKTFAYTTFTKFPSNPILSPISNSWESNRTAYPNVIYDSSDNNYKMWYSGYDGTKWSIGYATSYDGINWERHSSNPVLSWNNDPNEPKNFLTPFVIKDNNIYRMWYTSTPNDQNNFKIGYAESNDGINWNKITSGQIIPSADDNEFAVVSPNVLKISDTDYRLWYVFNNGSNWVIGYATSNDGLNWDKYENNPVITQTMSWEGSQTGKSSVIHKDGMFHMWYDTNTPNSAIAYAYSIDGIHWTKPSEYNPALLPGGQGGFNTFNIGAPSMISVNDNLLMFFIGLVNEFSGVQWKIGLAYQTTPSPSPTLLPTPTPTQIPTPTPSPTPLPVNVKKVIFIPGLGASTNIEDIAHCKSTPNAAWTLNIFGKIAYIPFIQTLENNGYEVSVFNYDWRKNINENIDNLSHLVNDFADSGEKVSLVGHSMGGLIGRSYLNQTFGEGKISTFITVGTPHKGATTTYPFWAGAENKFLSKMLKISSSLLIHSCKETYNISELNAIHTYFPSVQNMLPTFDYLRDKKSNTIKPVLSMNHKNNYFPDSFSFPYFSIRVGTLSGYGENTVLELETKNPTNREITRGEWLDGKTLKSKFTKSGDGTVLNLSSTLDDAENITIQGNHTEIIQSRTGINTIMRMLGNTQSLRSAFSVPEKNNASQINDLSYGTIIIGDPADIWITKNGKYITKDDQGMLFFDKPLSKTEDITIIPKGKETVIHIGQFTTKGEINWKTYRFKEKSQFKKKLRLLKDTIVNNPLE